MDNGIIMKTLIIIPAYNEALNLPAVIEDLRNCCPESDIIGVNDCSCDNTASVFESLNVPYLDLSVNLGIGGAVQAGYKYALKNDFDIAVQFDGDGQHKAEYIKALIEPIENNLADIVIGSRFIDRKGFQSSACRRLGIHFLSQLIKWFSGADIKDVTSGMRAVNSRMIALYADNYPQDYPEPDAILMGALQGAKIAEVPVQMRERVSGESSINAAKSIYYMFKVSLSLMISKITLKKRIKK